MAARNPKHQDPNDEDEDGGKRIYSNSGRAHISPFLPGVADKRLGES